MLVQHPADLVRIQVRDRCAAGPATDEVRETSTLPNSASTAATTARAATGSVRSPGTASTRRGRVQLGNQRREAPGVGAIERHPGPVGEQTGGRRRDRPDRWRR